MSGQIHNIIYNRERERNFTSENANKTQPMCLDGMQVQTHVNRLNPDGEHIAREAATILEIKE